MKKGQVSTFVIIGFVILLFVISYVVITSTTELSIFQNTISINEKIDALKQSLTQCIRQEVVNAIKSGNVSVIESRSIICNYQEQATNGYTIIQEAPSQITITEDQAGILITINYPLRIIKGNTNTKLEPFIDYLPSTIIEELLLEHGKTVSDVSIKTSTDTGRLLLPQGTRVEQARTEVHTTKTNNTAILSDIITINQNSFDPWGALLIYYPHEGNVAIVDVRTNSTLPSSRTGEYITTQITHGGSYYVGSCEVYTCQ